MSGEAALVERVRREVDLALSKQQDGQHPTRNTEERARAIIEEVADAVEDDALYLTWKGVADWLRQQARGDG